MIKIPRKIKKTIPTITIKTIESYEIQCPYCKTFIRGGYNKESLRILCSYCNNPIDINWNKAEIHSSIYSIQKKYISAFFDDMAKRSSAIQQDSKIREKIVDNFLKTIKDEKNI